MVTGYSSACQIRVAYSRMERSVDKHPVRAVLSTDILFHLARLAQAVLTADCARM